MLSSRALLLALAAAPSTFAYTLSYLGCYSSASGLTKNNVYTYQSDGYCQTQCLADNNAPVMALTDGDICYCGTEEPPTSAKVDDSNCNMNCTGYPENICGGSSYWSVWLTGTESDVAVSGSTTTSSSSSAATTGSSTSNTGTSTTDSATAVTSVTAGKTIVVTESASASSSADSSSSSSGKSHTGAIAAGCVVGVVAVAAIIGGIIFWMRYRRKRAAEQEYRDNQTSFVHGGKPVIPAVRRSPSGPDSRFDAEAMAHRRLSDGSIADNEDFSRRILKVTNPDDR